MPPSTGRRASEGQAVRIQGQPSTRPTIQRITKYRGSEPEGMRRMEPQLVRPPRLRRKPNPRRAFRPVEHLEPGHPKPAMDRIKNLPRPVAWIQPKRERNRALVPLHAAVEAGHVAFSTERS